MKKINILTLTISFLLVVLLCSAMSMSAVADNYRWSLVAMNPWNGVEGMSFTISYFLKTDKNISIPLTLLILCILWWRLFTLIKRLLNRYI